MTPFDTTTKGEPVHRITIANGPLSASILTLGVALQDVRLQGTPHSLTIGSPALAPYENEMQYCGTIVGPVANRIGGAAAQIDGKTHHFDANLNGQHTLHGGTSGTHSKVWTIADTGPAHCEFHLDLTHNAHGFPGNRYLSARYQITNTTLKLDLTAHTDAPTLMNLANHSYWRLTSEPSYAGQRLSIPADHYLPVTPDALPTGEITPVQNTRFDFRNGRILQASSNEPLDTNFCLGTDRQPLREIAQLTCQNGLTLTMSSTEPGLQVFDGHNLNFPKISGNDGVPYLAFAGLALEAQFWPDAPNNPNFPDITLLPGTPYRQTTTWTFNSPR